MEKLFHTLVDEGVNRVGIFNEFKNEYESICPKGGEILYINGHVICLLHGDSGSSDEGDDKPYL